MSTITVKPFEELAREWTPRAKRFLTLVANQLTFRIKKRLPGLVTGSAFLLIAVFSVATLAAYLSTAGWFTLRDRGFSEVDSSLIVAGAFLLIAFVSALIGRAKARKPLKEKLGVLEPESHEIEDAGQELVTLFKDLTIAAKRSLSPNEVLKPHAVKIAVASTAVGFLIALNLNQSRKETSQ